MTVHIGNVIKKIVKTKQINIDDFATSINCTRRNVYKIFDKQSIDTDLLLVISKALKQNLFFNYIKDEEIADYKNKSIKTIELIEKLNTIESLIYSLKTECKKKKEC